MEVAGVSLAFGAVAALLAAWAGSPRLALTPDSVAYLNTAGNLLLGRGLISTITRAGDPGITAPFAAWPPLFPLLLACFRQITSDTVAAARALQLVVVILTAIPVGLLADKLAGRRAVIGVLTFYAVLRPLLLVASFAWSESTFILLSATSILLLVEGVGMENTRRGLFYLAAAGLVAGLAMLTRYVGLVVIATGLICLIMHADNETSGRRTMRTLTCFGAPAIIPNLVWLARNWVASGFLFGEDRGLSLLDPHSVVLAALRTFWTDAVVPPTIDHGAVHYVLVIIGLSSFGLLAAVCIRKFGPELLGGSTQRRVAVTALTTFACLYVVTVVSLSLRIPYDPINTRIMAPIYPAVLLLGAFLLRPTLDGSAGRRARSVSWIAVGCLLLIQAGASYRYLVGPKEDRELTRPYWRSVLFADPRWARDPAIRGTIAEPPAGAMIYSNIADAFALWTDRPVKSLPRRETPGLGELLGQQPGALVLIHPLHRRPIVGIEEMDKLVSQGRATRLGRRGEGYLYRVEH